jgi:hypothetical protein
MADPPSRSKPGTPPREEVQRERTVIVPSTDSVEDIVAKLIEGTDVTKLREIAKGLNAHVKSASTNSGSTEIGAGCFSSS